jgi:hypothetical protein
MKKAIYILFYLFIQASACIIKPISKWQDGSEGLTKIKKVDYWFYYLKTNKRRGIDEANKKPNGFYRTK